MEPSVSNDNRQSSNSIKAIDKQTVHQICSGQVVLDLSTAVKELVENSIDAGAKNVEIRLKEYGKEFIEVSDNGQGIKEEDFEALALKHYTSKLREFNDLPSVNTFGFRGEALSSLSALGDLSITTHHESMQVGSKLTFDHDGKLVDRRNTARENGTSVCISNLFYTLPVRHKEFHRNYKKDFSKLMNILYAFCLVNGTVRINCINQVGSKKNKLISTNGKNCVLDTITTIFGANQVKTLIQIEQSDPLDTVLDEYHISKDIFSTYADMFLINGYISLVTHGSGRSVTDRQFFFINNRPCDFPKLARVVNEVYHMYNNHQYPFVYLNMVLNKDYVDVNVTPDKRQIMIHQENILLVIVKSTLKKMFEQNATFFAENRVTNMGTPIQISSTSSPIVATKTSIGLPEGSIESQQSQSSPLNKYQSPLQKSTALKEIHPNLSQLGMFKSKNDKSAFNDSNSSLDTSLLSPLDRFRSKYEKSPSSTNSSFTKKQKTPEQSNLMSFFSTEPKKRKFDEDLMDNMPKKTMLECIDIELDGQYNDSLKSETRIYSDKDDNNDFTVGESNAQIVMNDESFNENNDTTNVREFGNNSSLVDNVSTDAEVLCEKTYDSDTDVCIVDEVAVNINLRPSVDVDFNFQKIKESYANYIDNKFDKDKKKTSGAFHAKISASDNQNAEEELGKNITKDMFHRMKIIGQFNLGFIITKLADDLFIVDQHATDEKYNYETLQLKKCLKGQRLIQPITMNLTLVNESVLIDNLEIFQKNGFEFDIKEEDLPEQSMLTDEKSIDYPNMLDDGMQLPDILNQSVDIQEQHATIGGEVLKESDVILNHSGVVKQPDPNLQEQINGDPKQPKDKLENLYVEKKEIDGGQKLPDDIQKKPDFIGEHLIGISEKQETNVGEGPGDVIEIAPDASLVEEQIDIPRECESRIKLLTVPTSRNWTFSVDDVEELIYLLTESPGVMCRPSRVHKMFASRACRKSIMIGTALNKQQMKRLVSHMAEIDHPWNCPHGRPTMRHLINLSRIDC